MCSRGMTGKPQTKYKECLIRGNNRGKYDGITNPNWMRWTPKGSVFILNGLRSPSGLNGRLYLPPVDVDVVGSKPIRHPNRP